MPDQLLRRLSDELVKVRESQQSIQTLAVEQDRELTPQDKELLQRQTARMKDLAGQIEVLSDRVDISASAQSRVAELRGEDGGDAAYQEFRTVGEYLVDLYDADYSNADKRRKEARNRIETSRRIEQRAVQHVTTPDFAAAFPPAVVGPVIDHMNRTRPLVNALGVSSVPGSGMSFARPILTDPGLTSGMAVQAAEKDELASAKFSLTTAPVSLKTIGGYLNLSQQLIRRGPVTVQFVIDQLVARYAVATEASAVAEIGKNTASVPLAAGADAAATTAAIYAAAQAFFAANGSMPSLIVSGAIGWGALAGKSDTTGRPLFSPSGDATSMALNPLGLRLIVTPAITDDAIWVTGFGATENYEDLIGALSVVEPSVAGLQIAYAGMFASYNAGTSVKIDVA